MVVWSLCSWVGYWGWVGFTQGFLLATNPLVPVGYYDNHNTDSVTSITSLATDWCEGLRINWTQVQTEAALVDFIGWPPWWNVQGCRGSDQHAQGVRRRRCHHTKRCQETGKIKEKSNIRHLGHPKTHRSRWGVWPYPLGKMRKWKKPLLIC